MAGKANSCQSVAVLIACSTEDVITTFAIGTGSFTGESLAKTLGFNITRPKEHPCDNAEPSQIPFLYTPNIHNDVFSRLSGTLRAGPVSQERSSIPGSGLVSEQANEAVVGWKNAHIKTCTVAVVC
ncbi:hypothetical protein LX36DRAFT_651439 [Colletotrichum falcatum]|nr:hypothetical protein LX36DRAFT_651439 [Colletotrichum falcatum]